MSNLGDSGRSRSGRSDALPSGPALVGLAVLKVEWELRGRDYVDGFVPMIAECIRTLPDDIISLPVLEQAVRARFGLRLPLNALRTIVHRCAREGYVRKERGIYTRERVACARLTFMETEAKVTSVVDTVVSGLIQYVQHDGVDAKPRGGCNF